MEPVLTVERLSVVFNTSRGAVKALRDVELCVPAGRVVAVVGESGCGKSSLVASILGLLAANGRICAGRIVFEGRNLLELSEMELEALRGNRLSVVFQDHMTALNPVLSVGRQMTDIQFRRPVPLTEKRTRAASFLARVGIPDAQERLRHFPHEFSGGMRQRIAIAMAIMVEPALLIADEPTTALDATLEIEIIELLKSLQGDAGCSLLLISHHLGLVAQVADDVVVMYAGEVVEQGSVQDVFAYPRHPYTQMLLACDPARIATPSRRLPTIPGKLPDLVDLPSGCTFNPRCPFAFDACKHRRPQLSPVGKNHCAACHLLAAATSG
jgi:oligopeptide/dipeptide ABC transporter ATP-binding protein